MEEEFNDALSKDLGHNPFVANLQAHSVTKAEIEDLIDGVCSWSKPESVPTSMGTSFVMQDSGGLHVRYNMNH